MDTNDSMKPQQTAGLKLMTVFIAVLALHVLVIGGFTVYHLMSSGTGDADVTFDKDHKLKADGTPIADANAPDATATEKSSDPAAPATTPATDGASTAVTTAPATPAPEATAATTADSAAPAGVNPAPTASASPVTPAATTPLVISSQDMAQSSAIAPGLLPPPEPSATAATPAPVAPEATASSQAPVASPAPASPAPMTPATSGPIMPDDSLASGPVHMPVTGPNTGTTATASTADHHGSPMHEAKHELYTVKITDSYKKIAHSHHITVAQLKEANHIRDNVLHAGQKLIIPEEKTSLVKGDSSPEVGTPSRVVLSDTSSTASLSASPEAEHHHHHVYTVAKGDTLKYLARKFNVSVAALKDANNLASSKLTVGEKLKIPSKEARSAGTTLSAPAPTQPQPSQVETQPTPIAPVAQPAPVEPPAPQPTPASNPELANLTF